MRRGKGVSCLNRVRGGTSDCRSLLTNVGIHGEAALSQTYRLFRTSDELTARRPWRTFLVILVVLRNIPGTAKPLRTIGDSAVWVVIICTISLPLGRISTILGFSQWMALEPLEIFRNPRSERDSNGKPCYYGGLSLTSPTACPVWGNAQDPALTETPSMDVSSRIAIIQMATYMVHWNL